MTIDVVMKCGYVIFRTVLKKHERICIENFIAATWELF